MEINENWGGKRNQKTAVKVGKSPLKLMPSSISPEHLATWLPKVFMLRNIFSMRVKIISSPDKHSTGLSQPLAHERYFQRIMASQRQGHCPCLWATHLPNTVEPEQWAIQRENIKTLTRTSPKGLLLPRQWTQLTELRGLSWFCSVPDLSQGERFGTKRGPGQTPQAMNSPPQPHSPAMSQRTFHCLNAGHGLWLLGPNIGCLPSHVSVWLPLPSLFPCYIILLLTPLLQSPSLSHSFFFPPISPCSQISNLKQKLKSKNILN